MITLHITIATVIFSVMFAYRNYWQIKELNVTSWIVDDIGEKTRLEMQYYKSKWHKWQFALQIYIGVVISFISFVSDFSLLNSLGHGLLFGSTFWLVFDTLLGYLLTKNLLHVDSNGIGTIYKKLSIYIVDYKWQIKKLLKQLKEKELCEPFTEVKKAEKLAQYLLFISKVLFFALSVVLSLI